VKRQPGAKARRGSTEAGGSDGAAQTKAEFIAAANALCAKRRQRAQAKLSRIFRSAPRNESKQAGLQRTVETAIAPEMEAEAEELRALGAPRGDEEAVEAIVKALEAVVAEAREDPAAFVNQPGVFKSAERAARAYGLDVCGRVS